MKPGPAGDAARELERLAAEAGSARYVLRLFVAGMTPRSTAAVASLREVCERHLAGRYDLEVIDLYQQPEMAESDQVLAAPTLVKSLPLPLRRLVGDLSDQGRLLAGLGLSPGA